MLYKSFLIHIYSVLVSWKNGNISGKIMEFDSGIWLETLLIEQVKVTSQVCCKMKQKQTALARFPQ